jgi:arsenite-transporting ATPase
MRIIVYTGKGGVGKTSISSATALRCADLGYRTLVVSTDTAHSLGDSLQMELGPEPINVTTNLDAQEIDVHYSLQKYWGEVQKLAVEMFTDHGVDDVIAEEVAILPGLEEGASLLWLAEFAKNDSYDVVVIDAAPTAETLRLLTLPDAARWWIQKLLPLGQKAARLLGPLARGFGINAPDAKTIAAVQRLFETLDEVRGMLSDSSTSSMRLVVNAERMVIKETQRTFTYLNLYGYPVDAVICNRLLPESITDPHFKAWKESQLEHIDRIHECFDPLPLVTAPLFDREMGGLDLLRTMADKLFGERDPAEHLFQGDVQSVEATEGGYVMRLPLPLADKSQIDLYRSSDELTLSVGSYRRNIALPRVLWPLEVASAKLDNGILTLRFIAQEGT